MFALGSSPGPSILLMGGSLTAPYFAPGFLNLMNSALIGGLPSVNNLRHKNFALKQPLENLLETLIRHRSWVVGLGSPRRWLLRALSFLNSA